MLLFSICVCDISKKIFEVLIQCEFIFRFKGTVANVDIEFSLAVPKYTVIEICHEIRDKFWKSHENVWIKMCILHTMYLCRGNSVNCGHKSQSSGVV